MSQNNLATLLNLENLPEQERNAVLERVGSLVIQASVGSLLTTLNEQQIYDLEEYIHHATDQEDAFAFLLRTFPDFQSIVEKEVAALNFEAANLMTKDVD
tara:strand:+ start:511 stop:810 length:300 start_codon:yes stop_codon:yes gene_type:complete